MLPRHAPPAPVVDGVLMCPPEAFEVLDEKNDFMRGQQGRVDRARAAAQWRALADTYRDEGLRVVTLPALPAAEDMVFCANPSALVPGDATVGHLTQELGIRPGERMADVVRRRTGVAAASRALDEATAAIAAGDPGADTAYDSALGRWLRLGGADLDHRLDDVLGRVGLRAGADDQDAAGLSGGERARVNLACVLLAGFDVLCLDEPTNDLDLAGLDLLERFVTGAEAGMLLVSHDRAFLARTVTAVLELDEHDRTATRFDGGWQAYLDQRSDSRRHAEEAYADYVDKRDSLKNRAQQQRQWADQGRKKVAQSGETDKFIRHHRTAQTEKLAGKAKQTERAIERLTAVDKPWEGWDLRLRFADQARSGAEVAVARDLVVDRGGFTLGPVDVDVAAGERVALVGPNGSGKTTLLGALLGDVEPTSGRASLGPSVVVGMLDQRRGRFGSGAPLLDAFVAETGTERTEARSQLAKLGLGAEHVRRPSDRLSPGERTRAVLAAFALSGVNLLVLDEPTNHLDLPAIEQLEEALEHYPGTLLLVTHDRELLERVTLTRRVALDGGVVVEDVPL